MICARKANPSLVAIVGEPMPMMTADCPAAQLLQAAAEPPLKRVNNCV